MHPARLPQLPHPRIHQGISSPALLPRLKFRLSGFLPFEAVELRPVVAGGQLRIGIQQLPAELPPAELGPEDPDVGRRLTWEAEADLVSDSERTDLAEAEMGGEPAGAFYSGHIPPGPVLLSRPVEEIIQPVVRSGLAGFPGPRQAAAPVR